VLIRAATGREGHVRVYDPEAMEERPRVVRRSALKLLIRSGTTRSSGPDAGRLHEWKQSCIRTSRRCAG